MKSSTLRKLPIPFFVACLLGVGVIGFLVFGSSKDKSQSAAKLGQAGTTAANRVPANSPRYGDRSGVAKLNRSGGNTSGTNIAAKRTGTPSKQVVKTDAGQQTKKSTINAIADSSKQTTDLGSNQELAAATPEPSEETLAKTSNTTDLVTSSVESPTRRQLDRIKTAPVSTASQATDSNSYSTENPDPSSLLSEVMNEVEETEDVLDTQEPDVVMPPPVELTNDDASDSQSESESVMDSDDTANEDSIDDQLVAEDDQESTADDQVVNGELETDTEIDSQLVRFFNPDENELPVWFVINQRKIQLKPGQFLKVNTPDSLLVRFARGGELGVERVVTHEGDWEFSVSRKAGWKLAQK